MGPAAGHRQASRHCLTAGKWMGGGRRNGGSCCAGDYHRQSENSNSKFHTQLPLGQICIDSGWLPGHLRILAHEFAVNPSFSASLANIFTVTLLRSLQTDVTAHG